ncbi:hypothetical protein D3C78_1669310 [compost metagenome]
MEGAVQPQRLADVGQVLFGDAARTLAEHQRGVAGQAYGIGNQQCHGDDHEDRLQHALNEKSGHEAPPRFAPGRISNVNAASAPLAGCRGAGFAGPQACPLEGEAR